jgi:hypothetical protein
MKGGRRSAASVPSAAALVALAFAGCSPQTIPVAGPTAIADGGGGDARDARSEACAQCECFAEEISCGGVCVNPTTSSAHCGASGACSGASAGASCTDGKTCQAGVCACSPGALGGPSVFVLTGAATGGPVGSQREAIADFNLDGKPDVALLDPQNTVGIFLDGPGGRLAVHGTYPTGGTPVAVLAGDLNGDGKPDLAVANNTDATVGVLLGDGAGGVSLQTPFAVGGQPTALAQGDFNGDGKPDLATANGGGNTVSILLNAGGGAFSPHVTYPVGGQPFAVAVGDFNGDDKPDLAVANENQTATSDAGTIGVLINRGDGTFAPQVEYAAGTPSIPNGMPSGIAVADYNLDGKPDLAVSNANSHIWMGIFINRGDGTFAPQVTYGYSANGPSSIAVGDFNQDGKPDLVVSTAEGADIMLNGAIATFGIFDVATPYPIGADAGAGLPTAVAVADFNGDGAPDVAVASSDESVSILLDNCQ